MNWPRRAPQVRRLLQLERRRQHPDNARPRRIPIPLCHHLANHRSVAAKLCPPKVVAQHRHRWRPVPLIAKLKQASIQRTYAQHRKQTRRCAPLQRNHRPPVHIPNTADASTPQPRIGGKQPLQLRRPRSHLFLRGQHLLADSQPLTPRRNPHQLLRLHIRQRSQQRCIHQAERHYRRPNSQRQRRHHHRRPPRLPPQAAPPIPQIPRPALKPRPAPTIPALLGYPVLAPKRALRLPQTRQVKLQLVLQILLLPFAPEHHPSSSTHPIAATASSHIPVSASSCRRPASVSW